LLDATAIRGFSKYPGLLFDKTWVSGTVFPVRIFCTEQMFILVGMNKF